MSKKGEQAPFHESIIAAINGVKSTEELRICTRLIVATKVPAGHKEVIESLRQKAIELNGGNTDGLKKAICLLRVAAKEKDEKEKHAPEIKKISAAIGVYAGIINPEKNGKLLLRRRVEEHSIIPGKSFKGNWELPGGAVMETPDTDIFYNHYLVDLLRNVKERTGISLSPTVLPPMHLVILKGPTGYDLGAVAVVFSLEEPTVEDTIYVSPGELLRLAREFAAADKKTGKDGVGLLSGYGKRMHCMALVALCQSTNREYIRRATEMLEKITNSWI